MGKGPGGRAQRAILLSDDCVGPQVQLKSWVSETPDSRTQTKPDIPEPYMTAQIFDGERI